MSRRLPHTIPLRLMTTIALLLSGLAAPAWQPAAQASPAPLDWRAAVRELRDPPASPPLVPARSALAVTSTRAATPSARLLPAPALAEVRMGQPGRSQRVGALPVELSAGGAPAAGRTLRVEVLDAAIAQRLGVAGFAMRISGPGGAALGAAPLPVTVSVDYAAYAERWGAGYADRLRLLALPACAAATPVPDGCALGGRPLPSRNERHRTRLVAGIDDLTRVTTGSGGDPVVLAVSAAPDGEEGSFKATPLALSDDWQVRTGSGDFSYNYDVPIPKAPAGPTPTVRLGYSSGAVDGLVSGKNTQSGPIGLGWGTFADSFIERRYNSCRSDGQGTDDLCWKSDNATISLNGRAGELVPMPGTSPRQWRLKDDPRWRIEQLTGVAENGDNDGEHWRVTTPDGVQHYFGRGVNPDVGSHTNSVFTVPVFGDDPGEPCNTVTPVNWCRQAWRWNLDLVIDPHDNVQQYEYVREVNHYAALNGWPGFEHTEYVRGGLLKMIKYGKRRAPGETEPSARVDFEVDYRCVNLAAGCQEPTPATAAEYPDTPVDLMCFTAVCAPHAPTFFTALRYVSLTTQVEVGNGDFADVDTISLAQGFLDPDANRPGDQKLYLTAIQRKGRTSSPPITLPAVTFWPVLLNNRVDVGGGLSAMPHYRVGVVTNEYGGQTIVTYGQPHPCAGPLPNPPNWHLNTRNCYPHWYAPEGSAGGFAVFHKYVVTQVEQRDPVAGSPPMITTYKYGDAVAAGLPNGAWHHDRDEFITNSVQTWSEWRGYADVLVSQGASRTQYRVFRGMNADRLAGDPFPGPGSRVARTSSLDGTVVNVSDDNWLAGAILDQQSLRADGTVLTGRVNGYHAQRTLDAPGPDPLDDVWFVAANDVVDRRRDPADGTFARRRTQTVYNGLLGTVDKVVEHGWLASTGDERCTLTVPTANASAWLLDLPASVTRYANASCDGAEATREEYAYDGAAFGAAPVKGDRTGTRVKITAAPTWATTTTTYDKLGRPTTVTDPNGHAATTAYTPAIRYPATTTITNALGHVTSTAWFRLRQAPERVTDARGKRTGFTYDALGRTATVHRPTEQSTGAPPSYQFLYDIDPAKAKPGVVRTRTLQDGNRYLDSWMITDAWLRPRQVHVPSPTQGKVIVTDTRYDERGLVAATTLPQALDGAAGQALVAKPGSGWANEITTAFDELQRPFWEITWSAGVYRRSFGTEYSHDAATRTPHPPSGGITRSVNDAYDRVIRVEEREGNTWRATRYGYDSADRLVSVTDPAGNIITNTFDLAGRRTRMADPDMGTWTYGYDVAGNPTRVTSATGQQVHTSYDPLNRQLQRRKDSATGPLLASWEYDAPGERGLPNRSTRFDGTGTYVVDVTGYDDRARPTGRAWSFPGATYSVGYGYDAADHPTKITYPAVGGLPAETVTTGYTALGRPETMTGAAEYVWATVYDDRARPTWTLSGSRTVPFGQVREYDTDQRVKAIKAGGGSTVLQDLQFTYDPTFGAIRERLSTLGGQTARECFGYDERQRLTRAFTTNGTCATGTPDTGANPYNQTYQHSPDGNLTQRTDGTATTTYTYPPPGSPRPHAPTAVGGNTYTWNANGDLAGRTMSGTAENLTWSPERLLSSTGNSSFVYDADGNRLQRTTPAGTTRYIDGHEITGTAAVRTYSFAGAILATRSSGGVEYLATDNQGSVQLSVPTAGTAPSKIRAYQPYGKPRTTDTTTTDRGWIGQIEDTATGLNYLNARYYDAGIGRFISPDPLFDYTRPQTINPYTYGLSNPVAYADPSGLIPDACRNGEMQCEHNGTGWTNPATPTPPPSDICTPGSSGSNHPTCGPDKLELQTESDLPEAVQDVHDALGTTDTALDVSDVGLQICRRDICAKVTSLADKLPAVAGFTPLDIPGAIAVGIECYDTGLTSDQCMRAIFGEVFEKIPIAGQIYVVVDALDIDLSKLPGQAKRLVLRIWDEFFKSEGNDPGLTHDPEVVEEYNQPVRPTGSASPYQTCGVTNPPPGSPPIYCEPPDD
ncbi:RHS repeat-associated core domain-containing protein [Nonomuraea endophytica]|uniref:RHS repeat-associated protein n=1 Tax=Nonomuraea endophytica TaxID=714136 RepID=A0A7W8A4L0_9ACTN|nr:RHS repeat-associated core domain-containing protein [Nonomuraea endophytica]MBB5079472.1 RHS repeat-associated protein [Nonomuraea endophytica]